MNGQSHGTGCGGAVNIDGNPNQHYCKGDGYNKEKYPWYKKCCEWDGNECQPKQFGSN